MSPSVPPPVGVSLSVAGLQSWHAWLTRVLDLPLPATYRDAEHEYFVLLQRLYNPDPDQEASAGLTCDVRQENRPMIVPLDRVLPEADQEGYGELRAYHDWLHEQRAVHRR